MDVKTMLKYAIKYAIDYEESFVDAIDGCDDESTNAAREHALDFIKSAKAYQARHYGKPKSVFDEGKFVSIIDIMNEGKEPTP